MATQQIIRLTDNYLEDTWMHTVSHYLHTASVQPHCFGLDWQINDGDLIRNLIAESIQLNFLCYQRPAGY